MKLPKVKKTLRIFCFICALSTLFVFSILASDPIDISIEPELDISRFDAYNIKVTGLSDPATSISLDIEGGLYQEENGCLDYYVDGTCGSETISGKNFGEPTEEGGVYTYTSGNIYPDSIYPEIYFISSETSWNNAPLIKNIRRDNYDILYFKNSFEMTGDMSFWIEFNALPNAANSADLEIYLVGNNTKIEDLGQDWRNSENVEIVGTLNTKDIFPDKYHHEHSENSAHHLVALTTNEDTTIGSKSLDISEDFFIILYSRSPNINRGWNLRYHPEPLCTINNHWFVGSQFGWSIKTNEGCPDAHIHIARRGTPGDGIKALVTINGTLHEGEFYFGELPNLPPNPTSFISPTAGGTYSGIITIAWNPATDPNQDDTLSYNITLLDETLNIEDIIGADIETTSIENFDTEDYDDGNYSLEIEVCDNHDECVSSIMDNYFTIDNTDEIAKIEAITISSNNANPLYAKIGDEITLEFETNYNIDLDPEKTAITFYSAGYDLEGEVNIENTGGTEYTASIEIQEEDKTGVVSFDIISECLDSIYSDTTDNSSVKIYTEPPPPPTPSHQAGTYNNNIYITLSAKEQDHYIKYMLNNNSQYSLTDSGVTCNSGELYTQPILINQSTTLNAISCDPAGNISAVLSAQYILTNTESPLQQDQDEEDDNSSTTESKTKDSQADGLLAKSGSTRNLLFLSISVLIISIYLLKIVIKSKKIGINN